MRLVFVLAVFVSVVLSQRALAFPELVKHGYPNCMACHVSPSGGGVLTEYGRALSKELMSTWGREGEERFMWFVPTTDKYAFGGDYRIINLKDTTSSGFRERTIVMQQDIEAAVMIKKFTLDATAGLYDPQLKGQNQFLSRRHYVIYQARDELAIRAGRFYPAFGLLLPEHNSYIRRGLGWDQNMETYNIEGAWQNDKWNVFVTAILGRPDDKTLKRESGVAVSVAFNPNDRYKVAFNHYYGETDVITHHYFGPHAILGFSKRLYLLTQITGVRSFPYTSSDALWGVMNYNRFDFEFYKGMHVFVSQEFSQVDLKSNLTRGDMYGVGLQFFPRPHFNFQTAVQKIYSGGTSGPPTDRVFFLGHFYL